jgi:hypothetical protein
MELSVLSKTLVGFVLEKAASSFFSVGLPKILRELGQIHYLTALDALELRKKSRDPSRETGIAISHLLFVRNMLKDSWDRYWNPGFFAEIWGWNKKTPEGEAEDSRELCEVTILLATCHHFLCEKELADQFINEALEYFEHYRARSETTEVRSSMFRLNWRSAAELESRRRENAAARKLMTRLKKSLAFETAS